MTDFIFPLVSLEGVAPWLFSALALLLGVAFGFFLERAGFGSAINLTSVFILRDFRVFRVMFSAVITAMLGSQLLHFLGILNLGLVAYDATFFWSMLIGGLVFGVGFYVGGYCPGTAAVALARGRWDAPAFLFGIVLGIYGFALLFDAVGTQAWFANFYAPADAARQTLASDGPVWPWVLGLTAVALIGFKVTPIVERRFGLKTVEQLEQAKAGETVSPNQPPVIKGVLLKAGAPVAGIAAIAVLALELTTPAHVTTLRQDAPRPTEIAVDEPDVPTVDPRSFASWVIGEAHRRADEDPPNAFFLDLRPEAESADHAIPGATTIALGDGDAEEQLANLIIGLRGIEGADNPNKPVVIIDADAAEGTSQLTRELRRRGFNAQLLDGGYAAWRSQILDSDQPLLAFDFRRQEPEAAPPAAPTEANDEQAEANAPEAGDEEAGGQGQEAGDEEAGGQGHEAGDEEAGGQGQEAGDEEAGDAHAEAGDEETGEAVADAEASHGHGHQSPAPAAAEPVDEGPEIDLAQLNQNLRAWLAGQRDELPPRLALPGTVLLPAKAATVQATGAGGGGCG